MGLQNCHDGQRTNSIIKDFRALLDNPPDSTHCLVIFSGIPEFIKQKCYNNRYILDEQLHAMELCIYHGINVHVEGLDGECISQMCRCTESESWGGGDQRNDWVWIKQRPGSCYGSLNGSLQWQLQ